MVRVFFEGLGFQRPTEIAFPNADSSLRGHLNTVNREIASLPWNRLRLSCDGRTLSCLHASLSDLGVVDGSRIQVLGRLLGGGGDGGSTGTESRDAFLKMYKLPKADKVDAIEERIAKWTCCQLSGERLTPPCVCDELGTLFNKEAVVKALIEKTMPRSLSHITSLRHVIPLQLTEQSSTGVQDSVKDSSNYRRLRDGEVKFHCPITGLEFNGSFHFMVHATSGHVLSERAIKETPEIVIEILGKKATAEEWIPLNGSPEVVKKLNEKMLNRRLQKSKKRSRTKEETRTGQEEKIEEEKKSRTKKMKAEDYAPSDATKTIYASIFTKAGEKEQETFLCRSVGARGMNLT